MDSQQEQFRLELFLSDMQGFVIETLGIMNNAWRLFVKSKCLGLGESSLRLGLGHQLDNA